MEGKAAAVVGGADTVATIGMEDIREDGGTGGGDGWRAVVASSLLSGLLLLSLSFIILFMGF